MNSRDVKTFISFNIDFLGHFYNFLYILPLIQKVKYKKPKDVVKFTAVLINIYEPMDLPHDVL